MNIRIRNLEGNIAALIPRLVITHKGMDRLRAAIQEERELQKEEILSLWTALAGLPRDREVCPWRQFSRHEDTDYARGTIKPHHHVHLSGRCIPLPARFSERLGKDAPTWMASAAEIRSCWESAKSIYEKIETLRPTLKRLGVTVRTDPLKKVAEAVASQTWSIVEQEPATLECEAYAIFLDGGFMDERGMPGPLARAKLLPSQERAERAVERRSLSGVVVRLELEVDDMSGGNTACPDTLAMALAARQCDHLLSQTPASNKESNENNKPQRL